MLSPEASALLAKVACAIEVNPKLVDMKEWVRVADCGTICCVAGWIVKVADPAFLATARNDDVEFRAAAILGLDDQATQTLFYRMKWPAGFVLDLAETAAGSAEYARIVAQRVRLFILGDAREPIEKQLEEVGV